MFYNTLHLLFFKMAETPLVPGTSGIPATRVHLQPGQGGITQGHPVQGHGVLQQGHPAPGQTQAQIRPSSAQSMPGHTPPPQPHNSQDKMPLPSNQAMPGMMVGGLGQMRMGSITQGAPMRQNVAPGGGRVGPSPHMEPGMGDRPGSRPSSRDTHFVKESPPGLYSS